MEFMFDVEFKLDQKIIIIPAKIDELFQFIISQFIQKTSIEPNSVYFVANSKQIDPQQSIEKYMSDIDKKNNTISVFVNSINKEVYKNEKQTINHLKDIICPKCKEPCRFTIDNYKIKLFDCIHNHVTSDIKFDDFYKTQKIDIPDIKCDSCKNINKESSNNNEFFECLNCKETFCFLCKQKHELNHNIIKFYQRNYICSKHNNIFTKYCEDCRINICSLFNGEHVNHKTISFFDLKVDIEKSKKKLKEFRTLLDTFNEQIYEIIKKLNKLLEDINTCYKIYNNIFQSYDDKNIIIKITKLYQSD